MRPASLVTPLILALCAPISGQSTSQHVGVTWLGEAAGSPQVLRGFEEITSGVYQGLEITIRGDLDSREELEKLLGEWDRDLQAIVVLGDEALKTARDTVKSTPVFFAAHSHPVDLNVLANPGRPEGQRTGVSEAIVHGSPFEIFERIFPDLERVLLITETDNPASRREIERTLRLTRPRGIEVESRSVKTTEEALRLTRSAREAGFDAILIGSQPVPVDATRSIVHASPGVPVLSFCARPIPAGAVAGFHVDRVQLGRRLARQVLEHLLTRVPISDLPVSFDPDPALGLNARKLDELDLDVPFEILEVARLED